MSFGTEALKSPILMIACVERYIEPKEAVLLARLEEEYQVCTAKYLVFLCKIPRWLVTQSSLMMSHSHQININLLYYHFQCRR